MDLSWLIRGGGSSSLSSEATSFSAKGRLVHRRSRRHLFVRLISKLSKTTKESFFSYSMLRCPLTGLACERGGIRANISLLVLGFHLLRGRFGDMEENYFPIRLCDSSRAVMDSWIRGSFPRFLSHRVFRPIVVEMSGGGSSVLHIKASRTLSACNHGRRLSISDVRFPARHYRANRESCKTCDVDSC